MNTLSPATRPGKRVPALEVCDVEKRYGATVAVRAASFAVNAGEFFSLLGPSGSGKTTLLRVIAGFDLPTAGEVRLAGHAVGHLPPNQRRVNTVFQNYALFPHMDVFENIAFGLRMRRRPKAEIHRAVSEAMELVQLAPATFAKRRPRQLSGGEQQRVALARALVNKPDLLLLDEPLAALDKQLRVQMQRELRELQRKTGTTFLYVTHDQEEALSLSDRVAVMNRGDGAIPGGHIEQIGPPAEIYDRPATRFVCQFIGRSNLLEGVVRSRNGGHCEIQCAGLSLTVPCTLGAGDAASFLIRPEKLRLSPPSASDGPNRWPGVIVSRVLYGDTVGYAVAIGPITLEVKAVNSREHLYAEREQVQVSCEPSDIVVIPK